MTGLEIERVSEDRLSCEVWRFSMDAGFGCSKTVHLRLQFYGRSVRQSPRHKFKFEIKDRFNNMDRRSYYSGIAAADVPLPDDVKDAHTQARTIFADMIIAMTSAPDRTGLCGDSRHFGRCKMTDAHTIPEIGWHASDGSIRLNDDAATGELVFLICGTVYIPLTALSACEAYGWRARTTEMHGDLIVVSMGWPA